MVEVIVETYIFRRSDSVLMAIAHDAPNAALQLTAVMVNNDLERSEVVVMVRPDLRPEGTMPVLNDNVLAFERTPADLAKDAARESLRLKLEAQGYTHDEIGLLI